MGKIKLHDAQEQIFFDKHRFRVVCAGRRFGKSVLSQLIVLDWAIKTPGLYWIVAPTYKQSKQIHWRGLNALLPKEWIAKKNEVELSVTLANGSVIELKGAENPDSLRGVRLRGLVIDEIASIRSWDWLWTEVLRPTLTDFEAPALFISTPKGFNHFYDLYLLGQGDAKGQYISWRFTSYDNPYIPKQEIDNAKKELTEDTFQQEYMADFRKFTGLAHSQWDRSIHLIPPFEVPMSWNRARGFDYGSAHFTASPRVGISTEDIWFVETSYLDGNRDIKGHAEAIKAQDYGLGHIVAYGDPTGAQWFTEFGTHDLFIYKADKAVGQGFRGWVEYGVEMINQKLKPIPGHTVKLPDGRIIEHAPNMFVFDTPENQAFVRQIENLKWRETATGEVVPVLDETGDPTGGHFDLMAAFRYLVVSHKRQEPPPPPPSWAIERPAWSRPS